MLLPGPVQVVVVLVVLVHHTHTAGILILVRRKSQSKVFHGLDSRQCNVSLSKKCWDPNLWKSLRLWD